MKTLSFVCGTFVMSVSVVTPAVAQDGRSRDTEPSVTWEITDRQAVENGERLTIASTVLASDREVMVRMTSEPGVGGDALRPIVLVMDGPAYHDLVSGYADAMARRWGFPGLIIVSVPHANREFELSAAQHGGIGQNPFYRFLADELLPAIEANYPAAPYRVLAGHSSGGIFAVSAFLENDGVFNAFIAGAPPPLERLADGEEVPLMPEARIEDTPAGRPPRILYVGVGELDQDWFIDLARAFDEKLKTDAPDGVESIVEVLPGRTHSTSPARAFPNGLDVVFGPWEIPISYKIGFDIGLLRSWRATMKTRFGYDMIPPESVLIQKGMGPFFDGDVDVALPIFEYARELYSQSLDTAWYLANTYVGAERPVDALAVVDAALVQLAESDARNRVRVRFQGLHERLSGDNQ